MKSDRLHRTGQFHRIKLTYTMLPAICLVAFLCAGCGFREQGGIISGEQPAGRLVYMESTPIVDYPVPQVTPNVLVDRNGYQAGGGQRAAVKGRKLPQTFSLINADTGETVYTGNLWNVEYNEELEQYSAYADFDAWTSEGNFYLECEYVGRSYEFSVKRDLYRTLLEELCQEKVKRCEEKTITIPEIMQILVAFEWYPDIFPDEDNNGIPEIMEKIALWINGTKEQPVAQGQEAMYAAALAKFSFLYQKYDRKYATDCLKRASVVFDQTQNTLQKDAESFHALTELYRASGLAVYQNQIEEYRNYFENHTKFAEEKGYLYGAMTYIATRQKVDVELCEIFMSALMEEGEDISNLHRELIHPVMAHNNGAEDLLYHALELACANYVMENYQYNQVMEEFLHYLYGRNSKSVDFYELQPDEQTKGEYLVILAQLVAVDEKMRQ